MGLVFLARLKPEGGRLFRPIPLLCIYPSWLIAGIAFRLSTLFKIKTAVRGDQPNCRQTFQEMNRFFSIRGVLKGLGGKLSPGMATKILQNFWVRCAFAFSGITLNETTHSSSQKN
jgi:hypothetical protein